MTQSQVHEPLYVFVVIVDMQRRESMRTKTLKLIKTLKLMYFLITLRSEYPERVK